MTPERCKELLPVMQAFAEGREIQYSKKADGPIWYPAPCPAWNEYQSYRIKPARRVRPWTAEEAAGKAVVVNGSNNRIGIIDECGGKCFNPSRVHLAGFGWFNLSNVLENCTQLDGSPCGVEVSGE